MNPRVVALSALLAWPATLMCGCSTYRESAGNPSDQSFHISRAESSIARFRERDPSLSRFFSDSHAYAVFPEITKGAAGIGAAHGEGGVVYRGGAVVGFAEMTQVTVGAQLGGQDFEEVVFFQDAAAFEKFTRNQMEFSANASAVAATSGGAAAADYSEGVAVFTMPKGGLMFEASIGGQKFKYTPR